MMNSLILVLSVLAASSTAFVVQPTTRVISSSALFAKKKKGKTTKQQTKSGFAWASTFTLQPYEAQAARELASTAVASFKGRAGHHLVPEFESCADIPKTLWNAPTLACVIVQPGVADETNVLYANSAALETVGLKPTDFEQLFSTAAPPPRKDEEYEEEEEADEVAAEKPTDLKTTRTTTTTIQLNLPPVMKGDTKFERGYSKKMLKRDSEDITIVNAYRWDLEKSALVGGKFVTTSIGVAYAWSEWMVGETVLCRPGGIQEEVVDVGDVENKIAQQGAIIRDLKENQGLGNKDPQVVAAVVELLRLKDLKEAKQ
jgi:hypothetical protein